MSMAMKVKMANSNTTMKTVNSWIKTVSKITTRTTITELMMTKTNFD